MNKFDINKNKLEIGDIVVLCDCAEAISREFEFWEVYADGTTSLVYIKGLTSGKTDSFDCKCLKKVDKKYKELVDRATPKKVVKLKKSQYGYTHQCPSCEQLVGTIVYNVNVRTISEIEHDSYCCSCGQALDWSDEE